MLENYKIVFAATCTGLAIQSYWKILYKLDKDKITYNDNFNKVLFKVGNFKISGWSTIHYYYYYILAYTFSEQLLLLFFCGVIWEIIEDILSKFTKKKSINTKHTVVNLDKTISYTNWWEGSYQDIVINSIGIIHALSIKKIPYVGKIDLILHICLYNKIILNTYNTSISNYIFTKLNLWNKEFTLSTFILQFNPYIYYFMPNMLIYIIILIQMFFLIVVY